MLLMSRRKTTSFTQSTKQRKDRSSACTSTHASCKRSNSAKPAKTSHRDHHESTRRHENGNSLIQDKKAPLGGPSAPPQSLRKPEESGGTEFYQANDKTSLEDLAAQLAALDSVDHSGPNNEPKRFFEGNHLPSANDNVSVDKSFDILDVEPHSSFAEGYAELRQNLASRPTNLAGSELGKSLGRQNAVDNDATPTGAYAPKELNFPEPPSSFVGGPGNGGGSSGGGGGDLDFDELAKRFDQLKKK